MQRAVGDIEAGAVDRDGQQTFETGAGGTDRRGRPAQQVEQGLHRADTQMGPGVPERGAGDLHDPVSPPVRQ